MHGLHLLDRRGGLDHHPLLSVGGHQADVFEARLGYSIQSHRVIELVEYPGVTPYRSGRFGRSASGFGAEQRFHGRGHQGRYPQARQTRPETIYG